MKKIASLSLVLALCVAPTALFAASPWTTETAYSSKTINKLVFGAKNLALGWTELVTAPKNAVDNGENGFVGFGEGLMDAIVYTVGGALHVATFPVPIDVPLPNDGVQLDV